MAPFDRKVLQIGQFWGRQKGRQMGAIELQSGNHDALKGLKRLAGVMPACEVGGNQKDLCPSRLATVWQQYVRGCLLQGCMLAPRAASRASAPELPKSRCRTMFRNDL